ncbi:MAG: hypothetical protein MJ092_00395 [Lachnospiraceae bacterium]|nr:hypothetical protein [Lachnospiraceae bacterium]
MIRPKPLHTENNPTKNVAAAAPIPTDTARSFAKLITLFPAEARNIMDTKAIQKAGLFTIIRVGRSFVSIDSLRLTLSFVSGNGVFSFGFFTINAETAKTVPNAIPIKRSVFLHPTSGRRNIVSARLPKRRVDAPLSDRLMELERLYGEYHVHALCDALEVSRGTFYNHIKRN